MSHYPYLSGKDRTLAKQAISDIKHLAERASNPKLKSTASQWAMILNQCLKTPWPRATK